MQYSVRIDGGRFHKRKIAFDQHISIKPSASRVRTILFDWIRFDLQHRACLDLFAGSGILSFQALSWGAASSLCVDHNRNACKLIEQQASDLGANITCLHAVIPFNIEGLYDICFVDPPFDQSHLLHEALKMLPRSLKPGACVYIEWGEKLELSEWNIVKYKKVGDVHMHLVRKS
jgi:16S rRNA (guanine(966)-N(2))-methyltransferase RsmD